MVSLGAATVAGAAAVATRRQWSSAPDPIEGQTLDRLDGTETEVTSPDGAVISLTDGGEPNGPAVVLIHGWTEDRRVWGPVARRLAGAGLRVIAYDQRGHGRSGVGTDGYTIDAIAADLAAVLESLDLRDVTVAGHSMGGMAAQAFCIEHPGAAATRLRGLVLVATAAGNIGLGPTRTKQAARFLAHPLLDRAMADANLGPILVRGVVGRRPVLSHLQATARMFSGTAAATRTGFLAALGTLELSAGLKQFSWPVSIMVGSRDRLTPLAEARRMAALIPGAQLEIITDAGHMLPYEAPDRVAALIIATARGEEPARPAAAGSKRAASAVS